MDGRVSLAAPFFLSLLLTGCTSTQGAKQMGGIRPTDTVTKSTPPAEPTPPPTTPTTPAAPAAPAIAKKLKDGPKRQPSAEFIVSLAAMSEETGRKKKKDEPEQFVKAMDETRRLYQEALKVDPDYAKAQEGLVRVYTQLGEHHKAQDLIRKSLERRPNEGRLWLELGMTFNRQKNYEEALRAFRKALELDPENRQYMQSIGFTLVWSGRVHEGLDHLTVALGKAGAHYNVAGILRQQNHPEEAKQHLQICLEADPNFERARDMLTQMRPDAPAPAAPGTGVVPARGVPPTASPSVIPASAPPATPAPAPSGVLPSLGFIPL